MNRAKDNIFFARTTGRDGRWLLVSKSNGYRSTFQPSLDFTKAALGAILILLISRWWMVHHVLQTLARYASRENVSKLGAMGNLVPKRNSTSVACVEETTKAARKFQACSPNLCEWIWVESPKGQLKNWMDLGRPMTWFSTRQCFARSISDD